MQLGFLTDGKIEDVAFAATQGFDCLELALFGDTPLFDDKAAFQEALSDYGIALPAVSIFGQNYFSEESGDATALAERLKRVTELALALSAPILVVGTGTPPGADLPARVRAAADGLRPVIENAQLLLCPPKAHSLLLE